MANTFSRRNIINLLFSDMKPFSFSLNVYFHRCQKSIISFAAAKGMVLPAGWHAWQERVHDPALPNAHSPSKNRPAVFSLQAGFSQLFSLRQPSRGRFLLSAFYQQHIYANI